MNAENKNIYKENKYFSLWYFLQYQINMSETFTQKIVIKFRFG